MGLAKLDNYIYWVAYPLSIGRVHVNGSGYDPAFVRASTPVFDMDVDSGTVATAVQNVAMGVQQVALPAGLASSLRAKLLAAKAALDRGQHKTTLNILNATVNEIEAQSGKAIAPDTAERWISVIERIKVLIESGLSARER
jgi:hypothetical protein